MAKCNRCGKKGLFFKVGPDGICAKCQVIKLKEEQLAHDRKVRENEEKLQSLANQIADKEHLLAEARQLALTDAMRLTQAEHERTLRENEQLRKEHADLQGQRNDLRLEVEKLRKDATTAENRLTKLKPAAKSIKWAAEEWLMAENWRSAHRAAESLELDALLPQPDLNCLTMKQLRSQYNALRKNVIDLCKTNEARYTTKANATIYKLMVLAMESDLENILHKLQFGKLETGVNAVKELTSRYYQIAAEGNQSIAETLKRFIGQLEYYYLEIVATEYEYYVQRERAREEQRALKEQMRQEAEERKRLEAEKKKVEAEEKKYRQEMDRIAEQLKSAHDDELEVLRKRLAEMTALVSKVQEKKAEIVNLQNGKAGTVYIISNIGSFGDQVFKVGMTRRLEPQDRVNELGDASVPFPFDVHSFIFSEDAVALETALHKELNARRVNKVNLRKEFFNISIDELKNLVERIDPTAPFKETALAEQYRQSLSITEVPDSLPMYGDDEEEEEIA